MGLLDILFGGGVDKERVQELLNQNALVIDVRTDAEYKGGHVKGSKNIPLQGIDHKVKKLKALKRPLVLCCASGNRSGQAAEYLSKQGIECVNGGSWKQVRSLVNG